ncbi:MAG: [Fe-Fe] hydrogenase large subunit C-terminal domain-containing protein [Limnochordia bacterium]|jgi:PAS domain S-box-containing protein
MEFFLKTIQAQCKDCYKCVRHCPVKAIKVHTGHAQIWQERCILDGHCLSVCPQGAKQVLSDVDKVKTYLQQDTPVVVSLAPSYIASCHHPHKIVAGLKALGFSYVEETANGAELVAWAHRAYIEAHKGPFIASSCPGVVNLIEKHYPAARDYLIPIVSPMIAHGHLLRESYGPQCRVVFIGPCVAKKGEAAETQFQGVIDAVLTFTQLEEFFQDAGIDWAQLEAQPFDRPRTKWARLFPIGGGLLKTAHLTTDMLDQEMITVTGIQECQGMLKLLLSTEVPYRLIEMLACSGGCIDGPCIPVEDNIFEKRRRLMEHVHRQNKTVTEVQMEEPTLPSWLHRHYQDRQLRLPRPSDEEIRGILAKIGKPTPEQELNCGACGYDSCQEKAIAVYHGVAENEMCIPYMRAKAESLADLIIESTPNGIIVVDQNMEILAINPTAERLFHCRAADLLHHPVEELIPSDGFRKALQERSVIAQQREYPKYNLITHQYLFAPEDQEVVVGIFNDITSEQRQKAELSLLRRTTLENAQEVIDKQMRVAQEIAGLLGETTAETKVLLTKLMELMQEDVG